MASQLARPARPAATDGGLLQYMPLTAEVAESGKRQAVSRKEFGVRSQIRVIGDIDLTSQVFFGIFELGVSWLPPTNLSIAEVVVPRPAWTGLLTLQPKSATTLVKQCDTMGIATLGDMIRKDLELVKAGNGCNEGTDMLDTSQLFKRVFAETPCDNDETLSFLRRFVAGGVVVKFFNARDVSVRGDEGVNVVSNQDTCHSYLPLAQYLQPCAPRHDQAGDPGGLLRTRFVCLHEADIGGTWKEQFRLQAFPFDVQNLSVRIGISWTHETFMHTPSSKGSTASLGHLHVVGPPKCVFKCLDHLEDLSEWELPRLKMSAGHMGDTAVVVITLCVARDWRSYFWRIFYVLMLVTLAALPATWLDAREDFADILAHLATMFLTAVAFLNMIMSIVPSIPYLTYMDKYVNACMLYLGFLMLAATLEHASPLPEEPQGYLHKLSIAGFVLVQGAFALYATFLRRRELAKQDCMVSPCYRGRRFDGSAVLMDDRLHLYLGEGAAPHATSKIKEEERPNVYMKHAVGVHSDVWGYE